VPTVRRERSTQQWLRLGVAVASIVLIALGALGAWVFAHSSEVNGRLVDRSTPALVASVRLEAALLDQETGIRGYALTGRPEFLQPYEDGVRDEQAQLAELRAHIPSDASAVRALDTVRQRAEAWREQVARPIEAGPGGEPGAADRVERGKALFDELRAAATAQQHVLQQDRDRARAELTDVRSLRTLAFSGIAAVLVVLAFLVFEGLRRGVTRPISLIVRDAERVADGDFAHPIAATGPADIRALAEAMEAMRRRLADELAYSAQARIRLNEQTEDLRRSNAELEQFAYVASHDLQEPLRKVASFCQLLQRRYVGQLDERADTYIAFAVDGASRMQTLINDLLAFSRVGRLDSETADLDLETVFASILDDLSMAVEETGATVVHDPLPHVVGNTGQLAMVLRNLVANAIKFRHTDRDPVVKVTVERDGAMWRFAVTDNGIGIDPTYAERIFVIFQRLHSREAYPGNGIGLAMARKIIENHGGRVHLDPEHRDGTRIVFTLPVRPQDL